MLAVGSGDRRRNIACLHAPPQVPGGVTLIWLTGLKSDMVSTKAEALAIWTKDRGLGLARFDYSGHGRSDGRFEDALISDWLEEALAIFARITKGPVILVGSSTGGYVALLMLQRLLATRDPEVSRIKGLVLIAPAWDLTEDLMWKAFPQEARDAILNDGRWVRPSAYDPAGYVITRKFIEDGRRLLIGGAPFNPGRPISVLQGALDSDVPPEHARRLMALIEGGWGSLTEVPDGGHRLSRPQDLAALYALIDDQLTRLAGAHKS